MAVCILNRGLTVKPVILTEMNSLCQVDLIDMQANLDDNYKLIIRTT